ncbi:MAG: hypothetical protein J2P20_18205, partial [Pseudonocardia sp.]|nr:hypothetical protein [Pseudonocardia sp.]
MTVVLVAPRSAMLPPPSPDASTTPGPIAVGPLPHDDASSAPLPSIPPGPLLLPLPIMPPIPLPAPAPP